MLVIDANVALAACGAEDGFTTLGDELAKHPADVVGGPSDPASSARKRRDPQ